MSARRGLEEALLASLLGGGGMARPRRRTPEELELARNRDRMRLDEFEALDRRRSFAACEALLQAEPAKVQRLYMVHVLTSEDAWAFVWRYGRGDAQEAARKRLVARLLAALMAAGSTLHQYKADVQAALREEGQSVEGLLDTDLGGQ